MFVLVSVAVGTIVGSVLGRFLTARDSPPAVFHPRAHEEPAHLSVEQLHALLAPYEHAA